MAQRDQNAWHTLQQYLGDGPGVVGFLDVDGLMEVNSTHGRDVGDRLLSEVAESLTVWVSGVEDCIADRISGDEFGFVLRNRTLEEGFLLAEDLRRRIAEGQNRPSVTIGVANLPRDAAHFDELWRKAEVACWLAKEQGGNRVGLPAKDEMVLKSCYYPSSSIGRLRSLAERMRKKESELFREALERLLEYYNTQLPAEDKHRGALPQE
ncbi:diguanylate cyclase domain-containing protein [Sulfobacillus harzensis]|uniref:Diguanylate cyclase n=1 Tax=Sulfobacillus harzensis TaxID=2729629 RepID=A0A7Y0L4G4_9FIRM|nr:diguanylate cyclase [Sulfobacillus harzensis]NMP23142.1 diguanylate cyclase [Sulfobacillus harzensis]